jgi:hypothetical protein
MVNRDIKQKFCYSKMILIIFTILITTTSVFIFTIPVKPVYAQFTYRNSCVGGDPNRVLTTLSFGVEPSAARGFYYSFNIINPSGRLQEQYVTSGIAHQFFQLNHDGTASPWNHPVTTAQEGPGRYTIQVFQVTGHSGSATLIGTITIDLPFCETPPVPPGRLRVILQVIGGPGTPPSIRDISEFRLQVVGNTQAEPFTAVPGGNTITINPGLFRVNQLTNIPDYRVSFSGDCDSRGIGTMTSGANLVCTVTNTYTQPSEGTATLRVFKEVINDNLGLRQPGDFTIRITGRSGVGGTYAPPNNIFAGLDRSLGGTTITLRPGEYSVKEEPSSLISGPNALYTVRYSPECSGNLAAGQTTTCIVTNDDIRQPGVYSLSATHLNIVKAVIPPPQVVNRFSVDIEGTSNNVRSNLNIGIGPPPLQVTIQTGEYRVVERPVPAGYAAIYSEDCIGTLTGEVVPARTCTITNVAVIENMSASNKGISLTPESQECLRDPSCIALSQIPPSLVTCLQTPECIRTLTISTSTGMTVMSNQTKKQLETEYNMSKSGNLTQEPVTNAFNQTFNTSTSNITSLANQITIPLRDNHSKNMTTSPFNTTN